MDRWSDIQIGSNLYIIKFDRKNEENRESFTFWLSDFKRLWSESLNSKDELLQRFIDNNPTPYDDEITNELIEALTLRENYKQINADIKTGDDEIKFEFKLHLNEDVSVDLHWLLKKCNEEMFFEQITKPSLRQIGDNEKLIEIIKKKDEEIAQYKLVYTDPLRKRFITQPFLETNLSHQTFSCSIEKFESIIGTLTKNVTKDEPKTEIVSPPKSKFMQRGRYRPRPVFREIVKPGVIYDASDDDDDDTNQVKIESQAEMKTEAAQETIKSVPEPKTPSPRKRIRRDFNL